MCVIIHRTANAIIPPEKIESACIVNADGFGLAIVDRGKIELVKEFNPKGNDPERVLKLLEEAKDLDLLLHLRFTTVGAKNIDNCHPFIVTKHEEDGIDIVMAHNGTISSFNIVGNDFSDSYMFNEMIIRPLIERSLLSSDVEPETILQDDFVQLVLEEFVPSSSVVSFLDSNGKSLHIHENNGFEHEGWWSSNNYSFERTHRTKGSSVTSFQGSRPYYSAPYRDQYTSEGWPGWDEEEKENPGALDAHLCDNTNPDPRTNVSLPYNSPTTPDDTEAQKVTARKEEYAKIAYTFKRAKDNKSPCPSNSLIKLATAPRTSFCKMAGIDKLEEVCIFEREDISELVHSYPETTILLIQDLLRELYIHGKTIEGDKNQGRDIALDVLNAQRGTPLLPAPKTTLPEHFLAGDQNVGSPVMGCSIH
jgi:hypothetical protein